MNQLSTKTMDDGYGPDCAIVDTLNRERLIENDNVQYHLIKRRERERERLGMANYNYGD